MVNVKKKAEMLRVTYLVDFFRTVEAGTERQLSHLLTCLPNENIGIDLISLQGSPFLRNEAEGLFDKVRIRQLGARSDLSRSLPSLVRLFSILRRDPPDLVHSFFPASNSLGILIARSAGIKTLVSSRRDMGYNLSRKDVTLLRLANRFVSCVAVNAGAVGERAKSMERIPSEKIKVIYNGLSLKEFSWSAAVGPDRGEPPVVAIVANFNREVKRLDLFIKAAALVHEKVRGARFWIIGDGHLRKQLENLAAGLGLGNRIAFLGRRNDIPKILREVSIGVNCSDSEGMSNAILEYLACGIPVVATDVGGNREALAGGRLGILVAADNPGALAEGIIRLLDNPGVARRMGNDGRETLEKNFSAQKMVEETKKLYLTLTTPGSVEIAETLSIH